MVHEPLQLVGRVQAERILAVVPDCVGGQALPRVLQFLFHTLPLAARQLCQRPVDLLQPSESFVTVRGPRGRAPRGRSAAADQRLLLRATSTEARRLYGI